MLLDCFPTLKSPWEEEEGKQKVSSLPLKNLTCNPSMVWGIHIVDLHPWLF